MPTPIPKSTRVLIAFASVYIIWGSTYGAIHVAGEHLSAPVVAAARSLLTAAIITAICLARRQSLRVPPGEPGKLVLIGLLFMSGNNMMLTWGEKMVPSGFASLIIATIPIMIALLEMLLFRLGRGGEPLNALGWLGTLLGMSGIGVLVWPAMRAETGHGAAMAGASRPVLGVLVLLGAALSFALGSVLSRRFRFQADTFVATGWQIGAAGIFNLLVAVGGGTAFHAQWSWKGLAAIAYLSVFGSLCGLVAFTYLLKNVAVTKVSTYAFVNPVIAVLLGVMLLHERLEPAELAGMAVIVCGVAMVVYSRVGRAPRPLAPRLE